MANQLQTTAYNLMATAPLGAPSAQGRRLGRAFVGCISGLGRSQRRFRYVHVPTPRPEVNCVDGLWLEGHQRNDRPQPTGPWS